jgi:hypothetical protein
MSENLGIDQASPSVPVEEETGGPVIDLTAQGEDNKALVRRFYAEAFNQGDLALVDELSASDFLDHNPPQDEDRGFVALLTRSHAGHDHWNREPCQE